MAELVADKEGLFAAEGLEIEWVARDQTPRNIDADVNSPDGLTAFGGHGSTFEKGGADMYNACEWGNYRRVQDTAVIGRQLGRRSIITCVALMVMPDSPVYTPQQLANKLIGVPYYFGSHYLAIQMLEGFIPREMITTCRAPNGSVARYNALMNGEVDATTLTEPFITLAEKEGCRIICQAHHHGTEVASDAGRCRDLREVQPGGQRGGQTYQRRQKEVFAVLHRLPRLAASRHRRLEGR